MMEIINIIININITIIIIEIPKGIFAKTFNISKIIQYLN